MMVIHVNWTSGGNRIGPNGNGYTFTQEEGETREEFKAKVTEAIELLETQYPPDVP